MRFVQLAGIFLRLFGYFYLSIYVTYTILTNFSNYPTDGKNVADFLFSHPGIAPLLGFSDMAGKIVGFIIVPLIFFQYLQKDISYEPIFRFPSLKLILISVGLLFLSLPWISALADWNKALPISEWFPTVGPEMEKMEKLSGSIIKMFLTWDNVEIVIISILFISVIPAIGEEIIFRGAMQQELLHWFRNPHIAIWISAFVFSFIHFQFFGFLPRFLLGALFGYVAYWTGSIWSSILLHFLNNFLTLIWLVLYHQKSTDLNPESTEYIPLYVVAIMVAGTAYLLKVLYQNKNIVSTERIDQLNGF
ncbi:MAG: CPBP family intramembrane glutamic endopeptidase [Cytophagaceae bacterium]